MTDAAIRLVDAEDGKPKAFTRVFSVPAGAPWDQARAAALDAKLGAPMPITELSLLIRRVDPWRPGSPTRYVAFYVRRTEVGEGFTAEATVDGKRLVASFAPAGRRTRQTQRLTMIAGGAVATTLILVACAIAAISVRRGAESTLREVERVAVVKARLARTVERDRRAARALDAAGLKGRTLAHYLGDIAWTSASKTPDARIEAVHWDHGLLAIEARGDAAPLVAGTRTVTKMEKPLRPGVWLWGVAEARPPS